MTSEQITSIKKQTQLALPSDDTYLYRLGIALYGFASINSFMTEIICHIDKSQDRISLLGKTSCLILYKFKEILKKMKIEGQYPEIHEVMSRTADLFEKLNDLRNDFVHPFPITNDKSEQILLRRKNSENKYFEVDNAFLNHFFSDLHDVSKGLYEIRKVVQPGL